MVKFDERDYVCCAIYNKKSKKYDMTWMKVLFIDNNGMFAGEIVSSSRFGIHEYIDSSNVVFKESGFYPNMFQVQSMKSYDLMTSQETYAVNQALDVIIVKMSSILESIEKIFDEIDYRLVDRRTHPYQFDLKMAIEKFKENQMINEFAFNCYEYIFHGNDIDIEKRKKKAKAVNDKFFKRTSDLVEI